MGKKNPEKLHLSNITKQFNLVNRNVFKRKKKRKGTIYSAQNPKLTGSCGKAQTYRERPDCNLTMNKSPQISSQLCSQNKGEKKHECRLLLPTSNSSKARINAQLCCWPSIETGICLQLCFPSPPLPVRTVESWVCWLDLSMLTYITLQHSTFH